MSFIYGSILLFILFAPGILLLKAFYAEEFKRKLISNNQVSDIVWTILPSICLHTIAILIITKISFYRVNAIVLGYIITNNTNNIASTIFSNIENNILAILIYNASLCIVAYLLGNLIRLYIIRFRLNLKFSKLRIAGKWFFLIQGLNLIYLARNFHFKLTNIDFIVVDALVDSKGGKNILYTGLLADVYYTNAGGLESIILKYPERKFIDDQNNQAKMIEYKLKTSQLVLSAGNIINVNIRYMTWVANNKKDQKILNKYKDYKEEISKIEIDKTISSYWSFITIIIILSFLIMNFKTIYILIMGSLLFLNSILYVLKYKKLVNSKHNMDTLLKMINFDNFSTKVVDFHA